MLRQIDPGNNINKSGMHHHTKLPLFFDVCKSAVSCDSIGALFTETHRKTQIDIFKRRRAYILNIVHKSYSSNDVQSQFDYVFHYRVSQSCYNQQDGCTGIFDIKEYGTLIYLLRQKLEHKDGNFLVIGGNAGFAQMNRRQQE